MAMIGKKITGYKIVKRIGVGGMGTVYLGKHTTLDRQAAIKVIDKKQAADQELQIEKRFRKEAVLHSKLGRHSKIIELFNYIKEDSYFYILMEYFESVELSTVIGKQTGPMVHERALPIFIQILQGIGHAH
jgi:serine/threonine-protein kinase|tara:strand:+ start:7203 stop:7595 length:393 start_codon:yes stop_codon:yes gene_type:complete